MYVFGLIWFPLILILIVVTRPEIKGVLIIPLLMIGNLFTIYLWYLEIAVIQHYCIVCITLYVVNYIMTAVAIKSMM